MKKVLLFVMLIGGISLLAQNKIEVSFDKAVIMVYGESIEQGMIKNIIVGSKSSVAARKNENKIILQALEEGFAETNMFVELANGNILNYVLVYNNNPSMNLHYEKVMSKADYVNNMVATDKNYKKEAAIKTVLENNERGAAIPTSLTTAKGEKINSEEENMLKLTTEKKGFIYDVGEVNYGVQTMCDGIWTHENKYIYRVHLKNTTEVDFNIGVVDMVVKSVSRGMKQKVGSDQRVEHRILGTSKKVAGKSSETILLQTDQVTFDKSKYLLIEIYEEHPGSRKLKMEVKATDLIAIRKLN